MLLLLAAAALPAPPLQAALKAAVGQELKDPYSAQYDWQTVKSETVYCGWVNAKNSFGAYEGYKPFMALYAIGNSGKAMVFSVDLSERIVGPTCLEKGYRLTR